MYAEKLFGGKKKKKKKKKTKLKTKGKTSNKILNTYMYITYIHIFMYICINTYIYRIYFVSATLGLIQTIIFQRRSHSDFGDEELTLEEVI